MKNGLLILGIASAFLAGGLATYGYDQATRKVEVVAAKTPIGEDTPITKDELTTVPMSLQAAKLLHAYVSESALVGQYLSTDVPAGIPIMRAMSDISADPQALIDRYAKTHGVSGIGLTVDVKGALLSEIHAGTSVMIFVTPPGVNAPTVPPYHLIVPVLQSTASGDGGTSLIVFLEDSYLGTNQTQSVVLNALLKGQVLVAPYSSDTPQSALVYVPGVVDTGTTSVLAKSTTDTEGAK